MPDELNMYLPGAARVTAMNSFTVFAGTSALIAIIAGSSDTPEMWVKLVIAS